MAQSVAFKCTYNDGGEGVFVGFTDTCSKLNIERNVLNQRVWCSNENCDCRQFYDSGMNGTKPERPCYESQLFRDWTIGAGTYHTGTRAGVPIHLNRVEPGKFAILTTRFPNEPEVDRRIVGLFQIERLDDDPETKLFATVESRIRLPLEEARELYFWAYVNTKSGRPDWRTGLFRYLDDAQVHRILEDVAETVRDEDTRFVVHSLIENNFGNTTAPPASGCLPEKSKNRSATVSVARKYGPGGEGEAHKSLKLRVAADPTLVGLPEESKANVEHRFESGDKVDIKFDLSDGTYAVVEIEATIPFPGAHQCVKYRALLEAELRLPINSGQVRAILVAYEFDHDTNEFTTYYGITTCALQPAPKSLASSNKI